MPAPETDFLDLIDLASSRVGGQAIAVSDEFFAEKENLLKPGRGVFIVDKYTENGKWMDGWESRRKRTPGHDWCIIRLGLPGIIRGLDVDTNHFLGNYPEHASVDACYAPGEPSIGDLAEGADWHSILPISALNGGAQNLFSILDKRPFTHVRLNIHPDGGVARFRVYGSVVPDSEKLKASGGLVDLAAVSSGGLSVLANDMFFSHRNNLIMPGRSENMGDGWETKRKRGPGHDWVIIQLGLEGSIRKVEVDTNHFKGNYPESCSLEGCVLPGGVPADYLTSRAVAWSEFLPRTQLQAHTRHFFEKELLEAGPFTHVRLNIFPDGGISRLRLFGEPTR